MMKNHARSSLWILALSLSAVPGLWAQNTDLPAVAYNDLQAADVRAVAQKPSLVDQWKDSVEYAVLLKQNGWKGWTYSSTGKHPEIEWVESYEQPSSEYRRQCEKSYRVGWKAVEAAAKSQTGELAVVMDLDETVLLNLGFQRENADVPYDPNKWNAWVRREEAQAVPGAKEFLDKVRGLGPNVHLVFMSDRLSSLDAYTKDNMRRLGLLDERDIFLSKKAGANGKEQKKDSKEVRRACVMTGKDGIDDRCKDYPPMVIIARFGDSLRDHFEVYGRAAALQTIDDYHWGTVDFVLPNPMYGQWARDYK